MRVRVPFKIVIPCCLLVIGTTGWLGTRHSDFMKEPSAETLDRIRTETLQKYPDPDHSVDALSAIDSPRHRPTDDEKSPEPRITYQEIHLAPTLDAYADRAPFGPEYLIAQAQLLEQAGHPQRALLAWERVLDRCQANDSQIDQTLAAIRTLKPQVPAWNPHPEHAIPVTIHIGTGSHTAEQLKPLLESLCNDLSTASGSTLRISYQIAVGNDQGASPTPVAIWMAGPDESSPSSDIVSFTATDATQLMPELARSVYELIRFRLSQTTPLSRPPALKAHHDPIITLQSAISRHAWMLLGKSLQATP